MLKTYMLSNTYRAIKTPMKVKNVIIFWDTHPEKENISRTDNFIMASLVWGYSIT